MLVLLWVCVLVSAFVAIKLCCLFGVFGRTGTFLLGHNEPYDKAHDNFVSWLLDNADEARAGEYQMVVIANKMQYAIWTANKYYGYGTRGKSGKPSLKNLNRLCELEAAAAANGGRWVRE